MFSWLRVFFEAFGKGFARIFTLGTIDYGNEENGKREKPSPLEPGRMRRTKAEVLDGQKERYHRRMMGGRH